MIGPGICEMGMDCSLIRELESKGAGDAIVLQSTQFLCNASNKLAILSRIAIMIKLILIVSIVARIGIPRF